MNGLNRVYIVDDHPLVREWLANLLSREPDLVVCGEAADARTALSEVERLQPDVVIVDITLSSGSGLELVKDIGRTSPRSVSLMLSMHDELVYAERALRAGARGYVRKRDTTRKIIMAIHEVLSGRLFLSDELKTLLAEKLVDGGTLATHVRRLSDRELEVFSMLGGGSGSREIADSLGISMKTVQVYCSRIKEKFHLETHNELLREAFRWRESGSIL
jgi:DNA-binding NarL/FixJ family response regulator